MKRETERRLVMEFYTSFGVCTREVSVISGGAMWMSMYGHPLSFGQFVGFMCVLCVSVLAMMLQSSGTAFNGLVFLVFYNVITAMLLMYYLSSLRSSR